MSILSCTEIKAFLRDHPACFLYLNTIITQIKQIYNSGTSNVRRKDGNMRWLLKMLEDCLIQWVGLQER